MKWAGKPKRVKTTFNGRTERGKYIKPFCPEKEERKRNDPNGGGWSPQLNTCGASVLRYPTIPHGKAGKPTSTPCSLHCATRLRKKSGILGVVLRFRF